MKLHIEIYNYNLCFKCFTAEQFDGNKLPEAVPYANTFPLSVNDLAFLPTFKNMDAITAKSNNAALDLFLIQLAGRYSKSKKYAVGETLFDENDRGSTMLLILTGTVEIFKQSTRDSTRIQLGRRGAGEFLGEMALVEELPRSATVIAQTNCEVLEFSKDSFEKIIQEQPELATRVLRSLSNKLRESDEFRIAELEENNRMLNATNEELVRLNTFLDCIIDRSPSAILLATRAGRIFRVNSAAITMFNLDNNGEKDLVDDLFADFKLSDFRDSSKDLWHGEVSGNRKGEQFSAYLSVASLSGHSDSVLHLLMCQDITELQEFHRAISEFEKYASVRDAAVELAHDLKNMFAILLGNVELVLMRLTEEQKHESKRAIDAIQQAIIDTNQFVEGIMSYREDESAFKPINLRTMMMALIRFCNMQGIFKEIKLDCNVSSNFPKSVMVKEGQIQSVVINLLTNAAEALHERTDISYKGINIDLSVDYTNKWALIKILDNGIGISEENVHKVFRESFTTKEDGHGIGLISIGRIINSHSGEIEIDSRLGQGTTFIIKLPLERGTKDA